MTTTFTLGGEVADYDDAAQTSIKAAFAKEAGVSSSAVRLTLSAGSVVVTAEIFVESAEAAESTSAGLATGIMASPASLTTALEEQFEQVRLADPTQLLSRVQQLMPACTPRRTASRA